MIEQSSGTCEDAGERRAIEELVRINVDAANSTPCYAKRGQHPKHHGCVAATFTVLDSVPTDLRQGLFAKPQSFDALIRFSNGRQQDDRHADAHGMAIKLLHVPGAKLLEGQESQTAQDFVLVDSDVFFTGDMSEYMFLNRGLLGKDQTLLEKLGFWVRLIFCHPFLLIRILKFTGKKPSSPLTSSYFSAVPFSIGRQAVKYVARPRSNAADRPVTTTNGLSEALARSLANETFSFDFGVDVQTDANSQPIEDPTVSWSRLADGRREWLARIEIQKQSVDPHSALAENLAYSPWHGLIEHRPLGLINHMRRPVYRSMAIHRHELNQVFPVDTSEVPATAGCAQHAGTGEEPAAAPSFAERSGGRAARGSGGAWKPARFIIGLFLAAACVLFEVKKFATAPWPPDNWICSVAGKSALNATMLSIKRRLY